MDCTFEFACWIATCAQYCDQWLTIADAAVTAALRELPCWIAQPLDQQWDELLSPVQDVVTTLSNVERIAAEIARYV